MKSLEQPHALDNVPNETASTAVANQPQTREVVTGPAISPMHKAHDRLDLMMLFSRAEQAGLSPLLELRREQSRFVVICTDEQWAAVQEAVK